MTTQARIWYPHTPYHITARGNRRNDIFRDEEDFQIYLTLMENALEYFENKFNIVCYCLMDNHVHIMIETKDMHFKYYMTRVNSIYAKFFNHKYNYIGHLYQDRYFSEFIETDSQALETSRYIHLNPVKANMVIKPEQYKWSSYSMYIGETKEKLINSGSILNYFNNREATQRIESAIINSKFEFPKMKILINLAPGNIKKSGTHFDLPMAIGLLIQSKQVIIEEINSFGLIGELSLNG